jgi:hypothetical protein
VKRLPKLLRLRPNSIRSSHIRPSSSRSYRTRFFSEIEVAIPSNSTACVRRVEILWDSAYLPGHGILNGGR